MNINIHVNIDPHATLLCFLGFPAAAAYAAYAGRGYTGYPGFGLPGGIAGYPAGKYFNLACMLMFHSIS